MKKIWNLIIVLMLMISISSLAIADDANENNDDLDFEDTNNDENETGDPQGNESEEPEGNETEEPDGNETTDPEDNETEEPEERGIDEETEEEIEIMNNTLGAEIRLLQLEKAITKNLLKGERAVSVLQAMNYNTTDLESILAELRQVLEEVQAANASDNDSVQIFVDLKLDAKNLTNQFRVAVRNLLGDEKIKNLRERVREIAGDELQNYSKKIRNRVKQFNRNQIHRLYGIIGVNDTLAEQYQNENVSIEEVKSQISKMVNKQIKEKRQQIFLELKRGNINKINYANEEAADAALNLEERQQNRRENRSENTNQNSNKNNNGKRKGQSG
jgi:hypothetical protein